MKMIDSHIHLDHYKDEVISYLLEDSDLLETFITVSFDLKSCIRNLQLSTKYPKVKPAFGYHPEQVLPSEKQLDELVNWINNHQEEMIAIGEVGLPYYLKADQKVSIKQYDQYTELLELFITLAKKWEKPIVLHAVYNDAPLACDLLERNSIKKAHFHWFKGDQKTICRMIENGYFISITPDVVYEEEIQQLVQMYPLTQIMIETDGPWPFEGPFHGKMTHPNMMIESVGMIAKIKNLSNADVMERLLQNTKQFYQLCD